MKNAFWTYWLILLGVFIVVIMLLVQSVTTNNQQDYFLVKELTEAAMVDAVDFAYYRQYGEIKINKEKFFESFIRRFAENASLTTTYTINFYDVYEAPPKASVEVKGKSGSFTVVGDSTSFDIVNRIDTILEGNVLDPNITDENPSSGSSGTTTPGTEENTQPGTTTPGSGTEGTTTENPSVTNPSTEGPTANKIESTEVTDSSITVHVVETAGSSKITEYFVSKDNGSNYESSSNNTFTFNGLSPDTSYNFKAYVKDEAGNVSPVITGSFKTNKAGNVPQSCLPDEENIQSRTLEGVHGTVMAGVGIYKDWSTQNPTDTIKAGNIYEILGSRNGANNIEWWAVKYTSNGQEKCGWMRTDTYAAIDMSEYLKGLVEFDIYNTYSSQYKTTYKGETFSPSSIKNKKLYSNDYRPIGVYSFAKQLKQAAQSARNDGYTLVVYDAYRPRGVTQKLYEAYNSLYYGNTKVQAAMNPYALGWYLSTGPSAHNTGCAVDISIKGATMPTDMHELSAAASKKNNNDFAKKLASYMVNAGLKTISSEWWHFEDNDTNKSCDHPTSCHQRIKCVTSNAGDYFWSAV